MVAILLVIAVLLFFILWKVCDMSAAIDTILEKLDVLESAVDGLPEAVNALEAVVTELKGQLPDPADREKLEQAAARIAAVADKVAAAKADAGDGVDEAVPPEAA